MPAFSSARSKAVTRIRRYSNSISNPSLDAIFLGSFRDLGKTRAAPLTVRPAPASCPANPSFSTGTPMPKHRILRIASTRDRVVTYREVWPTEPETFTREQQTALDLGCMVQTDEGTMVDLIAYYEVSESERGSRALDMVS
jgi:hypothetical protein